MIKSLVIDNFQSHEHSELEFDPGVNVIVGPSDSGKSAIMRAINWLATNKPSGTAFRSTFTDDDTAVALELDGADSIVRQRGKRDNSYWLNEQEFKSFGQEVPELVLSTLALGEVNVEHQLKGKPFFLLDDSPGEVARQLNKAVRLDQIDSSFAHANKALREHRRNADHWHTQANELEEQKSAYEHIPKTEKALARLEELAHQAKQKQREAEQLKTVVGGLKRIPPALAPILAIEARRDEIWRLRDDFLAMQQTNKDRVGLLALLVDLNNARKRLKSVAPTTTKENALSKLVDAYNNTEEDRAKLQGLRQIVNSIKQTRNKIAQTKKDVKSLQSKLAEIIPDVCPTCGQEWPNG